MKKADPKDFFFLSRDIYDLKNLKVLENFFNEWNKRITNRKWIIFLIYEYVLNIYFINLIKISSNNSISTSLSLSLDDLIT